MPMAGGIAGALAHPRVVDPAAYEHLVDPRIVERADARVPKVRAVGDPGEIGGAAFGLLLQRSSGTGSVRLARCALLPLVHPPLLQLPEGLGEFRAQLGELRAEVRAAL